MPGHPEGGDRDQRRDDDPDHLHRGIDSFDVVDQPERGDHQRPEQDPEVAAFRLDEDRHRHDDADHDRETADPRYGQGAVDARAVVLVVDAADSGGEARHEGRQQEHDAHSRHEAPDRRRVANERVHRVREGHCRRL